MGKYLNKLRTVRVREFRLRRARAADLPEIAHQRTGMFQGMGYADVPLLAKHEVVFRRWARPLMGSGRLVGFLVETKSSVPLIVAGGLVWVRNWQPHPTWARAYVPYLLNVYTHPKFRGRGLATMITHAAMQWARDRKFPHMVLHASPLGRRVYRRLGWNRTWEMKVVL